MKKCTDQAPINQMKLGGQMMREYLLTVSPMGCRWLRRHKVGIERCLLEFRRCVPRRCEIQPTDCACRVQPNLRLIRPLDFCRALPQQMTPEQAGQETEDEKKPPHEIVRGLFFCQTIKRPRGQDRTSSQGQRIYAEPLSKCTCLSPRLCVEQVPQSRISIPE